MAPAAAAGIQAVPAAVARRDPVTQITIATRSISACRILVRAAVFRSAIVRLVALVQVPAQDQAQVPLALVQGPDPLRVPVVCRY